MYACERWLQLLPRPHLSPLYVLWYFFTPLYIPFHSLRFLFHTHTQNLRIKEPIKLNTSYFPDVIYKQHTCAVMGHDHEVEMGV